MKRSKAIRLARLKNRKIETETRILQRAIRSAYLEFMNSNKITKAFNLKLEWELLKEKLVSKISNSYKKMFMDLSTDELINIKVKKKVDKIYLKKLGKKITNIVDSDKERVSKIIEQSVDEGLSNADITTKVYNTLDNVSRSRAKTIAVTEVRTMSSDIDYNLALEVGMTKKTWIHTSTGKTNRRNHEALNGVTIGIDEKFNLGNGIYADRPHDENLPASEVINCYCICIYE